MHPGGWQRNKVNPKLSLLYDCGPGIPAQLCSNRNKTRMTQPQFPSQSLSRGSVTSVDPELCRRMSFPSVMGEKGETSECNSLRKKNNFLKRAYSYAEHMYVREMALKEPLCNSRVLFSAKVKDDVRLLRFCSGPSGVKPHRMFCK